MFGSIFRSKRKATEKTPHESTPPAIGIPIGLDQCIPDGALSAEKAEPIKIRAPPLPPIPIHPKTVLYSRPLESALICLTRKAEELLEANAAPPADPGSGGPNFPAPQ